MRMYVDMCRHVNRHMHRHVCCVEKLTAMRVDMCVDVCVDVCKGTGKHVRMHTRISEARVLDGPTASRQGHNYIGHNFIGRNYVGHNYISEARVLDGLDRVPAGQPAMPRHAPSATAEQVPLWRPALGPSLPCLICHN